MKSKAFTLAEVLITLTIIGVIASMSIPSLVNNTNKQETVVKVKKEFAVLNQAFNMLKAKGIDINEVTSLNAGGAGTSDNLFNAFMTELSVSKKCWSHSGCFPDVTYLYLDGSESLSGIWNLNNHSNYSRAILGDGTPISFWDSGAVGCTSTAYAGYNNVCGVVSFDTNGFAPPNQLGRDLFQFLVTSNGVQVYLDDPIKCDLNGLTLAERQGSGCGAKILKENAINY